ncbi:hypothetical protein QPE03_17060 [Salmonella enterica subsp. enterica serovar Schwarzengrund]|nr:hypothetical protein [Salmonella enterica]WKM38741.1 hypothetical protein QPE03_17060 [Salmonella enterica subsp. enterica serovar Schwarzengrund]
MSNENKLPDSEYIASRFSTPFIVCVVAILLIFLILSTDESPNDFYQNH